MSYKAMAKRLEELEAASAPRVIAVQNTSAWHGDVGTVQLCVPGGDGERMTLDEWRRHYPNGTLIRIVYGDVDAGEPRQT